MENLTYFISIMTWSYSRLTLYETCPYSWFLQYLLHKEKDGNFYGEYGTFMHDLLQKYYLKELDKDQLFFEYIKKFDSEVTLNVRSRTFDTMKDNYYNAGLDYIGSFTDFEFSELLGVEQEISFNIGEYPFTGYIDLVGKDNDGKIVIIDHKSKDLKPRSKRKSPTKTDIELDEDLRQLYLYSIWVKDTYGEYPSELVFNCFKNGQIIREKFNEQKLEEAKEWALDIIHKVEKDKTWIALGDYYYCNHICNFRNICEFVND